MSYEGYGPHVTKHGAMDAAGHPESYARTPVRTEDNGAGATVRTWQRTIQDVRYAFTAVLMESGERRYFASRFNGYPGGERFACAWDRAAEITFRTDGSTRARRFPPRTDHYWVQPDYLRKREIRVTRTR